MAHLPRHLKHCTVCLKYWYSGPSLSHVRLQELNLCKKVIFSILFILVEKITIKVVLCRYVFYHFIIGSNFMNRGEGRHFKISVTIMVSGNKKKPLIVFFHRKFKNLKIRHIIRFYLII